MRERTTPGEKVQSRAAANAFAILIASTLQPLTLEGTVRTVNLGEPNSSRAAFRLPLLRKSATWLHSRGTQAHWIDKFDLMHAKNSLDKTADIAEWLFSFSQAKETFKLSTLAWTTCPLISGPKVEAANKSPKASKVLISSQVRSCRVQQTPSKITTCVWEASVHIQPPTPVPEASVNHSADGTGESQCIRGTTLTPWFESKAEMHHLRFVFKAGEIRMSPSEESPKPLAARRRATKPSFRNRRRKGTQELKLIKRIRHESSSFVERPLS